MKPKTSELCNHFPISVICGTCIWKWENRVVKLCSAVVGCRRKHHHGTYIFFGKRRKLHNEMSSDMWHQSSFAYCTYATRSSLSAVTRLTQSRMVYKISHFLYIQFCISVFNKRHTKCAQDLSGFIFRNRKRRSESTWEKSKQKIKTGTEYQWDGIVCIEFELICVYFGALIELKRRNCRQFH